MPTSSAGGGGIPEKIAQLPTRRGSRHPEAPLTPLKKGGASRAPRKDSVGGQKGLSVQRGGVRVGIRGSDARAFVVAPTRHPACAHTNWPASPRRGGKGGGCSGGTLAN